MDFGVFPKYFPPIFGFCSFKFSFLYYLGCCGDPQGLSLSLSIYLAASANLCCHSAERKKMAIGNWLVYCTSQLSQGAFYSPLLSVDLLAWCCVCYNFGLGLGLMLDSFYSKCLDLRLYLLPVFVLMLIYVI
jgi:hypothetical protein